MKISFQLLIFAIAIGGYNALSYSDTAQLVNPLISMSDILEGDTTIVYDTVEYAYQITGQ
jgi:hypothetical protein